MPAEMKAGGWKQPLLK